MSMAKTPPPLDPPGPPAFSLRRYFAADFPDGLLIFVEAIRSSYEEDWAQEVFSWRERGSFLSRCYSVVEPDGEIGMTPLSQVQPISPEEFRGALAGLRSGRWPADLGPTP